MGPPLETSPKRIEHTYKYNVTAFGEGVLLAECEEVQRVAREGVSEAEAEKARTQIEADVVFDRDSSDQIAASLSEAIAVADWEWYADYPSVIRSVPREEIQRVAQTYFNDDGLTVGVFLPKSAGSAGESAPDEEGDGE